MFLTEVFKHGSLETLDKTKGQSTLAIKRMQQAEEELEEIMDSSKYSSKKYGKVCKNVLNKLDGYTTKDHVMLTSLANDLRELNSSLFKNVASYLDQAAACLKSYEKYN